MADAIETCHSVVEADDAEFDRCESSALEETPTTTTTIPTGVDKLKWPPTLRPMLPICVYMFFSAAGSTMVGTIVPRQRAEYFGSESKAALWSGVFDALGALIGLFGGGLFGLASDAYGRKFVVQVSAFVLMVPYLFQVGLGSSNPWPFMVLGHASAAIGSTPLGNAAVGLTVLADVFDSDCRLVAFTIFIVCMFVGTMFAPIPSALGLSDFGVSMTGTAILVGVCAYVVVCFHETLPAASRKVVDVVTVSVQNPFAPLHRIFRDRLLACFAVLSFCFMFPFNVAAAINVYYFADKLEHGFSPTEYGLSMSVVGLSFLFMTALVAPLLVKLQVHPANQILLGICGLTFNSVYHCWVTRVGEVLLLLSPTMALSFVCLPVTSQIVSVVVPRNEQGVVNGAISAVKGVASVLGPILGAWLLSLGKEQLGSFIELPFVVSSVIAGSGAVLVVFWLRPELDQRNFGTHCPSPSPSALM